MKNRGDDGEIKRQKIIDGMTARAKKQYMLPFLIQNM